MIADNRAFVLAAYAIGAIVMLGYRRRLCRLERALASPARRRRSRGARP